MMVQAGNTAARKAIIKTATSLTKVETRLRLNLLSFRKFSTPSAGLVDLLPNSVKDSFKTSVLDEISRHDSKLWGDDTVIEDASTKATVNDTRLNGSIDTREFNASHLRSSLSSKNDAREENIDQPISPTRLQMLHDPLDKWYLDTQPSATTFVPTSPGSSDPFALAKSDLQTLSEGIRRDLIGSDHPVLAKAASYFFEEGHDAGKKIRPMMVLLLSRAMALHSRSSPTTNENETELSADINGTESQHQTIQQCQSDLKYHNYIPTPQVGQRQDLFRAQRRLAEISEMIHTASLFHDDVIDGAETRRGSPSVHKVFGNKMAILAGDYLLARASIFLARLRDAEVVETMSTIIEHLVRGEVMQMKGSITSGDDKKDYDLWRERLVQYLQKNFYKTGSLMANSCKSAAILGGYNDGVVGAAYRYGKHLGVAFQLVDDILDFDGSVSVMGKPALADLHAGIATAPVLFAAEMFPIEMEPLLERKFQEDGDIDKAVELVRKSDGIARTKDLAHVHVELAINAILELDQNVYRDSLIHLGHKVLGRTR